MTRRGARAAALLLAAAALGGCAPTASESGAGDAARAFAAPSRDAALGCDLLAPRTRAAVEQQADRPCPAALGEADLPVAGELREVSVYGRDAMARFEHDTLFLARFDEGWRVTAAGCTPVPDRPFDCLVAGG